MGHWKNSKHLLFALTLLTGVWGCRKSPAAGRGLGELGLTASVPEGWDAEDGSRPFWVEARESEGALSPRITIDEERSVPDRAFAEELAEDDRKIYGAGPHFAMTAVSTSEVSGAPGWSYTFSYLDQGQRGVETPKNYSGPIDVPAKRTTLIVKGPRKHFRIVYSAPLSLYEKYRPEFERWLRSIQFAP